MSKLTETQILLVLTTEEKAMWYRDADGFTGATPEKDRRVLLTRIARLRLEGVNRSVAEEELVRNLIAAANVAVSEGGKDGPLDDLANAVEDLENYIDGPSETSR